MALRTSVPGGGPAKPALRLPSSPSLTDSTPALSDHRDALHQRTAGTLGLPSETPHTVSESPQEPGEAWFGSGQAWKDLPQPQLELEFGLLITNPAPWKLSS